MRYLLLFIFLFQFVLSQENFQVSEESIFKKQAEIQAIIDEQFPQKEELEVPDDNESYINRLMLGEDAEFSSDDIKVEIEPVIKNLYEKAVLNSNLLDKNISKNLYANYEKSPRIIFKNQRFKISLKTTITTDEFDSIETRFINFRNVTILNSQNPWEYGNKNNFYNKYYFKVHSEDFMMPTFQIIMYKNSVISEIITLKPKKIKYKNISDDNENFSNVIAKDLKIVTHKTKQYTNNKLLTILELKATQGNLEDFSLSYIKEQGVNSVDENSFKQTAIYYAIVPLHTKKISFEYYNSVSNNFVKIQSAVVLKNELVSTQTDLNPNKSNVLFYKKVLLGSFAGFFLLLYLIRRRFLYIFLALIFLIIFILYMLPNEIVKIKQGSNLYILPTNKSTVFYKIDKLQNVEVLNKKDIFLKVIFKKSNVNKEIIGWVKESNIVKN